MAENEVSETKGPDGAAPVLVAVDFSSDSDAALLWASRHADSIGAPLHVLHVVHDPAEAAGFYHEEHGEAVAPMTDVAERMMETYLRERRDAHPELAALQSAEPQLVSGLPPGRIVEVAKRNGARIVVVGSRGRSGLDHILLGSVAERVVQLAPMPVVVVKQPSEA
jgi:nucleotide-binding universal stress UspA family protein